MLSKLIIFAAVAAGSGLCSDGAGVSGSTACGPDGCPTDQRCEANACVGESGPVYPIALRILPYDEALAPIEVRDVTAPDTPVRALDAPITVPAPILVSGQVLGDEDRSQRVARLIVEPIGGITAHPLNVTARFNPINPTLFSLNLTPSWPDTTPLTYRVRAVLSDLPPLDATLDWVPPARGLVIPLPYTEADLLTVAGEVRVFDLPVDGLRVIARDELTGRQVSNDGRTDANGRFTLRLSPTGAAQSVDIEISSRDPARPMPTYAIPITASADASAPLLIELPVPQPAVRSVIQVRGVLGDQRPAIAGAQVRLTATVGEGVHRVTGRTDANGQLAVLAFPGEYTLHITPPALSTSRITTITRTLGAQPAEVVLGARTPIEGAVVDADARPVPNAKVVATLLSDSTRVFETRTDTTGQFLLALDPGQHRLHITPPADLGLPPFVQRFEFQGDQPRTDVTIALPAAAVLTGQLIDADAAPIEGAAVEAWVLSEPPVRLIRALTDNSGAFNLRVPTRLQAED